MKWLTKKMVKSRRYPTWESALKDSFLHWKQLSTATAAELKKVIGRTVGIMSDNCACCQKRDQDGGYSCIQFCPLSFSHSFARLCCNELWRIAKDAFNKWKSDRTVKNFAAWQNAAKAVANYIEKKYKQQKVKQQKVKICRE